MKTLKLIGLQRYIGPRTGNLNVIENGQTVEVSDDDAAVMLEGFEWGKEGPVQHWEDVTGKKVEPEAVEEEHNSDDQGEEGSEGADGSADQTEQPKESDSEAPVAPKKVVQRRAKAK